MFDKSAYELPGWTQWEQIAYNALVLGVNQEWKIVNYMAEIGYAEEAARDSLREACRLWKDRTGEIAPACAHLFKPVDQAPPVREKELWEIEQEKELEKRRGRTLSYIIAWILYARLENVIVSDDEVRRLFDEAGVPSEWVSEAFDWISKEATDKEKMAGALPAFSGVLKIGMPEPFHAFVSLPTTKTIPAPEAPVPVPDFKGETVEETPVEELPSELFEKELFEDDTEIGKPF